MVHKEEHAVGTGPPGKGSEKAEQKADSLPCEKTPKWTTDVTLDLKLLKESSGFSANPGGSRLQQPKQH